MLQFFLSPAINALDYVVKLFDDVENIVTLNSRIWVAQGHWKLHHSIALGTVSYFHSIVTTALSCFIFATKHDIGRKLRFFIPHLHSTSPPQTHSPLEYCHKVWYKKTRMMWPPNGEKV